MDALLARIGSQAMNCIIRQGIFLTSGFAVQQCRRLMAAVDDRGLVQGAQGPAEATGLQDQGP